MSEVAYMWVTLSSLLTSAQPRSVGPADSSSPAAEACDAPGEEPEARAAAVAPSG